MNPLYRFTTTSDYRWYYRHAELVALSFDS